MNKKILSLAVVSVLGATVLTGCGKDEAMEKRLANTATIEQVNQLGEKIDQVGAGLASFQKVLNDTQALMLLKENANKKPEVPQKSAEEIKTILSSIGINGVETVESVTDDLFEVSSGTQFAYVSKDGKYMLAGPMIDIDNKRNLTQEKIALKTKIDTSTLDTSTTIKVVKGTGQDVYYMFSDPQCPYCRMLDKDIHAGKVPEFENATIYVYPVVVAGHPDAERMIKDVWCSDNPAAKWQEYLTNDEILKTYEEKKDKPVSCPTGKISPILVNEELMQKLKVRGTPAVYNAEGVSIR